MKILIVFGTRPEAIKMAPLVNILKTVGQFETKVCVTAQHRGMLDQVLNFFNIEPDFDLDIMSSDQSLNEISSKILKGMDEVLSIFEPDILLVHGDTSTTLYASLAAYNKQVKIAHVEAGLRTYDLEFPWPEESNRQLVGKIADLHFAPTESARVNLVNEGVRAHKIYVTGNTVIDSLFHTLDIIDSSSEVANNIEKKIGPFINGEKQILLVTGHRRENFGKGLENICEALIEISKLDHVQIVFSVHLNPNIKQPVHHMLAGITNIHLIEPLDYPSFVYLMKKSHIILTDSGGIQEEAPSLGKPVLVMRDKTERPEAIEAGTVKLVGATTERIVKETENLLLDTELYNKMSQIDNPYGDGTAVQHIK